jgi:ABC-type nitrate/sulfonate/bicarbonate transport system substrate-binding protein
MAAVAPTFLSSAHFTTTTWAKANPDALRRFQAAISQAVDWANKNHDQSALILEKVGRVAPDVVAASTRAYYGDRLEPGQLQPLVDVAAKYANFSPFPANEMLYRA